MSGLPVRSPFSRSEPRMDKRPKHPLVRPNDTLVSGARINSPLSAFHVLGSDPLFRPLLGFPVLSYHVLDAGRKAQDDTSEELKQHTREVIIFMRNTLTAILAGPGMGVFVGGHHGDDRRHLSAKPHADAPWFRAFRWPVGS